VRIVQNAPGRSAAPPGPTGKSRVFAAAVGAVVRRHQ
jgi:hypothetical protein